LGNGVFTIKMSPSDKLFIYAGQADAQDASHFTCEYEINGARGELDGWVQPSGTVILWPRSGTVQWTQVKTFFGPLDMPDWIPPGSLLAHSAMTP
jgi:hypothetical protein